MSLRFRPFMLIQISSHLRRHHKILVGAQRLICAPWVCCQGQGIHVAMANATKGHAVKAKVAPMGQLPRNPHGHAARDKACSLG